MTPEAKVRNPVVAWAKRQGWGHIRMTFRPGVETAWPDDQFLLPDGKAVFIEFKRPGKEPTPKQYGKLRKANELGFYADWFDNADAARAFLTFCLATPAIHGAGRGFPKDALLRWTAIEAGRPKDINHP